MQDDKTKGKFSQLKPETYKSDYIIEAWHDARNIATLVTWMEDQGLPVPTKASAVKYVIEMVAERLIEQGLARRFEFSGEAWDLLNFKFGSRKKGRGEKNLLHNLLLDEERKSGTSVQNFDDHRHVDPALRAKIREELEKQRRYDEMSLEERRRLALGTEEEGPDESPVFDQTTYRREGRTDEEIERERAERDTQQMEEIKDAKPSNEHMVKEE